MRINTFDTPWLQSIPSKQPLRYNMSHKTLNKTEVPCWKTANT